MAATVVLLHGFTQTAQSWPRTIVDRLEATGRTVVAVDAPGHGTSADVRTGLVDSAIELAGEHGLADWVGYSMGGRLALHLAVHRPEAVDRLVLIGATPGVEDDDERAARRRADDELADDIERDGVDAFLDRWLAKPLFATLHHDAAALDSRRTNTAAGLASSLRSMGTGVQQPLWDRLAQISARTLLLAGELDEKFTDIAERMRDVMGGNATFTPIAGAGHAVHLECPDEVAERIAAFLGDTDHATTNANANATP